MIILKARINNFIIIIITTSLYKPLYDILSSILLELVCILNNL